MGIGVGVGVGVGVDMGVGMHMGMGIVHVSSCMAPFHLDAAAVRFKAGRPFIFCNKREYKKKIMLARTAKPGVQFTAKQKNAPCSLLERRTHLMWCGYLGATGAALGQKGAPTFLFSVYHLLFFWFWMTPTYLMVHASGAGSPCSRATLYLWSLRTLCSIEKKTRSVAPPFHVVMWVACSCG